DCEPRAILLEEAVQLDQIPIPSATFKKELKTRTALALLPNVQPETADVIKREIEEGVDEDDRRTADLHTVMKGLADDEGGGGVGDAAQSGARGDAPRGGAAARPAAGRGAGRGVAAPGRGRSASGGGARRA